MNNPQPKVESMAIALDEHFHAPLQDLPTNLREVVEADPLLGILWDSISENQRRERAMRYDYQQDPANAPEIKAGIRLGYWSVVARNFGAPDWKYWLDLPSWTPREAACLIFELNPDRYEQVASDIYPLPRGLIEEIVSIERKAVREQQAGQLCERPSPDEWAKWAQSKGFALSDKWHSEGDTVKIGAGAAVKRNQWTDAALKALWQESILPGMTQKVLAEKFGITHQSISKQLKRASERFSKTKSKSSAKKKTWLS